MLGDTKEDPSSSAGKTAGKDARARAGKAQRIPTEKEGSEARGQSPLVTEERLKEERKIAHDQAKTVVKALIEYQRNCQEAVKEIFNPRVMSKSIINGIDSIIGEDEEARHYIPGYGPPPSLGMPMNTNDDGRRRYDVARERGYICVLFQGPEVLFAPKVRLNEKTLLLKEFFMFAPKPNEQANQVIKRFYDRVHDIKVTCITIPADQQMVILLEALSNDPMITETIIQLTLSRPRGN